MASTGTMSDYLVNMTLDAAMGDGTFTEPSNVYLGLTVGINAVNATLTTLDGDEPDVATPAWSDYARIELTAANFDASGTPARQKNYSADVDFGTATTTGDVDVLGWFITDAASGASGNVLFVGDLDGTITVQNGNPVKVTANNLDLAVSATKATIP